MNNIKRLIVFELLFLYCDVVFYEMAWGNPGFSRNTVRETLAQVAVTVRITLRIAPLCCVHRRIQWYCRRLARGQGCRSTKG